MSQHLAADLAFLLFLPVFALLGVLYWMFPRQPCNAVRRIADAAVLLSAAALSVVAMRWAFATATRAGGQLWPQILAALVAYGVFLAILCAALVVRGWILRRLR